MKLNKKQDLNIIYQVYVFWADRKNKMAALASDWLRHFDSSSETAEQNLTKLDWMQELNALQDARSQLPLPISCFFGQSEKQDGRTGLWLAEKFLTCPLKPLNRIQRNLTGCKISTFSTKIVFFRWIGKQDIFDFSETAERNSAKSDRK